MQEKDDRRVIFAPRLVTTFDSAGGTVEDDFGHGYTLDGWATEW